MELKQLLKLIAGVELIKILKDIDFTIVYSGESKYTPNYLSDKKVSQIIYGKSCLEVIIDE